MNIQVYVPEVLPLENASTSTVDYGGWEFGGCRKRKKFVPPRNQTPNL
jgi:hypothetical protein